MEKIFILQDIKRVMEYKNDFIIGIIGVALIQGTNLLFLNIIFSKIPNLDGWTFQQILFIYGFSLIPKGIDHLFFDNLWTLGQTTVRKGEFDKYLTRPLNPLFQVLMERFQLDALGEIMLGIIFLFISRDAVQIKWNIFNVLLLIIVFFSCALIYTAIKISSSALAFWIKKSNNITFMLYMLNDFAKYPTTIYNNVTKIIITYIIPFAFTAFYPASYFLNGENIGFSIGGVFIVLSVLMLLARFIWLRGLDAYESAGS